MKCEVDFCIYQKDGKCIVDKIQINSLGMCDTRIDVSFDSKFIEETKQKQLENIELRWSERNKYKKAVR